MAIPSAPQILGTSSPQTYVPPPVPSEDENIMNAVKERLGFVLRKRKSTIDHPEAGFGCFVDGSVKRGQFFCFYPGIVYLPGHIKHMKGYPNIDNENANLLSRYDHSIIDAKDGGGVDKDDILEHTNPLALGHYINHPPMGSLPSVMPYYFNFPLDFPTEFLPYIPNVYHRSPPSWVRHLEGDILVRRYAFVCCCVTCVYLSYLSAVFIALRDIKDEEIFFNYRYNPKLNPPSWYVSYYST